jgi:hypothetical protein
MKTIRLREPPASIGIDFSDYYISMGHHGSGAVDVNTIRLTNGRRVTYTQFHVQTSGGIVENGVYIAGYRAKASQLLHPLTLLDFIKGGRVYSVPEPEQDFVKDEIRNYLEKRGTKNLAKSFSFG